jgi:hypothetical protein
MPRASVRKRAITLAANIAGDEYSPEQRAAFACFGLLLVGELATRCESCATARLMTGVTTMATMGRH